MSKAHSSYLVSGANRGIGFGLVESLLKDENNVVFAGVRDTSKATALDELAKKSNGRLTVVKLESTNEKDAKEAAKLIEDKVGHLDVLIANAGISKQYSPLASAPLDEFREHFEINTLGPIVLYQAFRNLLLKSPTGAPKFVGISTAASSLTDQFPLPAHPYLLSKAAMNYVMTKIALEDGDQGMVAFSISPGWVQTDMGNAGATANGMEQAPVTVADSVNGILKVTSEAKKDTHSSIFYDFTGTTYKW